MPLFIGVYTFETSFEKREKMCWSPVEAILKKIFKIVMKGWLKKKYETVKTENIFKKMC